METSFWVTLLPSTHPQLPKPLLKRRDAVLCFRIVRGQRHEHADVPHSLGLLRVRRKRPNSRRACKRDELASGFLPLGRGTP
jgi:hypothetical protein